MDAGHWKTIKEILNDALEVGPAGREAFVRSACGGDRSLQREVEELLSYEANGSGDLEVSAAASLVGTAHIGRVIGRYRIIGELGEGGMGAVYLAERADGEFEQKVAIKLIRRGLDSATVLDRFVNERRILATLEHPNIARLIDGGTTDDGVPYFVMEYIDGKPIFDHVREHGCDIDARLSLFGRICSAVSYAHRNLVIHRDLKPSNILITSDGDVKLLDFGIAKVLDPTLSGEAPTQQYALTPEYASPEQLRGERLTTATDVYSLGVILFELLTGRRPLDTNGKNLGEVIQTVCESQPRRPSSIMRAATDHNERAISESSVRRLRGDLDSIVLKALRKEPAARYLSVEAFAKDLALHTAGQPVSARSGVWSYRARKFIARNRIAVIGATVVFATLVAGLIATLYQARVAHTERARAEKRFNDVRQLANSFVFEINDEIEKSPIRARSLLVERAVQYLDSLSTEAGGDESLSAELASAYEKIGDVQADIFRPNLGVAGNALVSQRKALDLRSSLFQRDPDNIQRGLDLARSHQKVGDILTVTGDIGAAADQYREAIKAAEALAAKEPSNAQVGVQLSNAYLMLGQAILRGGSLSDSLANYHRSFEINEKLIAANPFRKDLLRRQAVAHSYIGYVKVLMGKPEDAVSDFDTALAIERQAAAADPSNDRQKRAVISAVLWAGYGRREAGHAQEGLVNMREALVDQEKVVASDPDNFGERNSLGDCWLEIALTQEQMGRHKEAIAAYQKALSIYGAVSEHDSNDLSVRFQIEHTRRFLARTFFKSGWAADALKNYEEAATAIESLVSRDAGNLEWRFDLAECWLGSGKAMRSMKRDQEANEVILKARSTLEQLAAVSPENVKYTHSLTEIRDTLASPR